MGVGGNAILSMTVVVVVVICIFTICSYMVRAGIGYGAVCSKI